MDFNPEYRSSPETHDEMVRLFPKTARGDVTGYAEEIEALAALALEGPNALDDDPDGLDFALALEDSDPNLPAETEAEGEESFDGDKGVIISEEELEDLVESQRQRDDNSDFNRLLDEIDAAVQEDDSPEFEIIPDLLHNDWQLVMPFDGGDVELVVGQESSSHSDVIVISRQEYRRLLAGQREPKDGIQ